MPRPFLPCESNLNRCAGSLSAIEWPSFLPFGTSLALTQFAFKKNAMASPGAGVAPSCSPDGSNGSPVRDADPVWLPEVPRPPDPQPTRVRHRRQQPGDRFPHHLPAPYTPLNSPGPPALPRGWPFLLALGYCRFPIWNLQYVVQPEML